LLPRLLDEFDVLLYDYPGQGQSSQEDRPCSIPRFGDYLASIADLLRIDRLHVAGISYGGFVAFDLDRKLRPGVSPVSAVMLAGRVLLHNFSIEILFGVPNHFGHSTDEVIAELADLLRYGMLRQGQPAAPATAPAPGPSPRRA
jgi:pimeloyl-ACP methyl ester carboxylesterase